MITFEKGTIKDLKIISDLEKQCFNSYDCFSERIIRYLIKNPNNSVIVDIIKYDDRIAGYSVFLTRKNSNKIRLYSICISPAFRGKKIAFNYLKQRSSYFSKYYSQLILEVRISNKKALNLYKDLGFEGKGILSAYYSDGEDGLRLVKKLV